MFTLKKKNLNHPEYPSQKGYIKLLSKHYCDYGFIGQLYHEPVKDTVYSNRLTNYMHEPFEKI